MKDKILQAEGAELSRLLGEVLQPEPGDHDADKGSEFRCVKCGVLTYSFDDDYLAPPCIPDPIPLDDWNVAMKHFREADGEAIHEAMINVFLREVDDGKELSDRLASQPKDLLLSNANAWFLYYGKPKHCLQAAALCKLNAEDNNG